MSAPLQQRFICPNCKAVFAHASKFCGECGAKMVNVSPLEASRTAAMRTNRSTDVRRALPEGDRRIRESNSAWLGKIIDGRYRVLEPIGRGGVGVIYKVEHMRMGKIAAMKVMHRDLLADPEMAQRFEREATLVSKLTHPHTVQVFDFGTAEGSLYLIMEYVRGLDLGYIIERDGALPFSRVAPMLLQICGALGEAHTAGIVHRDLKPENVLITRANGNKEFAKVLDFGLAKIDQSDQPLVGTTDKTSIVGTPYFMSPEQIRGDDLDARADIYSFGALMFNVLTGEQVFTSHSAIGVLTRHLTDEPDTLSQRTAGRIDDPRINEICNKALQKDRGRRYQHIAEVASAIEAVLADSISDSGSGATTMPRTGTAAEFESDARLQRGDVDAFERQLRRRKYLIAGGLLLALVGAGAVIAMIITRPARPLSRELEPNNDLASANLIESGKAVTGHLGRRRTATEGDRDVFRLIDTPSDSARLVSIAISSIPNINMALSIVAPDGKALVMADEFAAEGGEAIVRRKVTGTAYIVVEQVRDPNSVHPTENVSDEYQLLVSTDQEIENMETEPNATAVDANAIRLNIAVNGTLERRNDLDTLRWAGADGEFNLELVQAAGGSARWRVGEGAWQRPGLVTTALKTGELIQLEREDKAAPEPNLAASTAPWTFTVRANPAK
jgi:eukaryotic-like serine/threonine-protein kinase